LLQDVDKRDFQLETLKDQQNESQKREENQKRQVDRLTYDNNSLQADLTAIRDELDEARQNANVHMTHQALPTGSLVFIITHTSCSCRVIIFIRNIVFVTLCTVKGTRLMLSTPNLVDV